jgi:hypothetical protein
VSSGLLIGASFGLKMLDDASGIASAFQDRNLHPINGASPSQTDPITGLFFWYVVLARPTLGRRQLLDMIWEVGRKTGLPGRVKRWVHKQLPDAGFDTYEAYEVYCDAWAES